MNADGETATNDEHLGGTSRRSVLGSAAAGFALAAGGLLLPDWLVEETAARPGGASSGQLGGRRGQDRRGRDKATRRGHGGEKDKRKRRGKSGKSLLFRSSALTVVNTSGHTLSVDFYHRPKYGPDAYDLPVLDFSVTLGSGDSARHENEYFRLGALVKGRDGHNVYADVRNISYFVPTAFVTWGLNLDPPGDNFGNELIAERVYFQGDSRSEIAGWSDLDKITLERPKDTSFIEWVLRISPLL